MSEDSSPKGQTLINSGIVPPPDGQPKIKTLTNLMVTNIIILAIVGIASIMVMLFGDFDGKGIRVTSTFLVFAAFTAFTAWDSNDKNPDWHLPIGQVGNIYMLGLSLIQIWATLGINTRNGNGGDGYGILGSVFMIIILVKIGTMVVQKIADLIFVNRKWLPPAAKISAGSFACATLLYTLPIGMGWIQLFKHENYGRLSTAVILLAGLSLAITVLLAWFYGVLATRKSFAIHSTANHQSQTQQVPQQSQVANHSVAVGVSSQLLKPQKTVEKELPTSVPNFEPPVRSSLPWPVFPNGSPLPAKSNGRPDFGSLREVARVYDEAETHWFGQ